MSKFFTNKAVRSFASGAAITLSSTVISCSFAIFIEGAANRTLYRFFPHLYKDVKYAYGLPHLSRRTQQTTTVDVNAFKLSSKDQYILTEPSF